VVRTAFLTWLTSRQQVSDLRSEQVKLVAQFEGCQQDLATARWSWPFWPSCGLGHPGHSAWPVWPGGHGPIRGSGAVSRHTNVSLQIGIFYIYFLMLVSFYVYSSRVYVLSHIFIVTCTPI
jgi:hypothetical protein